MKTHIVLPTAATTFGKLVCILRTASEPTPDQEYVFLVPDKHSPQGKAIMQLLDGETVAFMSWADAWRVHLKIAALLGVNAVVEFSMFGLAVEYRVKV